MATTVAQAQTVRDETLGRSVRDGDLAAAAISLAAVGLGPNAAGNYDEAALLAYIDERGWSYRLEAKGGGWIGNILAEISPDLDWYGIAGDIERVPALALALAALLRAPWSKLEQEQAPRAVGA